MRLRIGEYVGGAGLVRLYSLGGVQASQGTTIFESNSVEDFARVAQDVRYFFINQWG